MLIRYAGALCAAALAALLSGGPAQAHEGHDHGDTPPPATASALPRGEATSDKLELVAVYGQGRLTAYLDRFATNEPVGGAQVTLEGPSGPVTLAPGLDGSYSAELSWLAKPGQYDLLFTASAGGDADVLPVTLSVAEGGGPSQARPSGAEGWKEQLARPDPVLLGVAGTAFLLGLAVSFLFRRRRSLPVVAMLALSLMLTFAPRAMAHEGEEHNEARPPVASTAPSGELAQRLPDGTVFVPKPTQRILAIRTVISEAASYRRTIELPGRIIPDPNASGVVQSSVGGRLSAPESGFPRLGTRVKKGDVLAYVTPPVQRVDVSDMRQRQGELDQQIAIVQRRVERYQRLAPSGAIAQVQLDESVEELKGLKDRRVALDRLRAEAEALVAPVDGLIADSTAIAGQMASPGAVVFQVVDPKRLWVEALSFDTLASAVASARTSDGRNLKLAYQGSGFSDRNQSVPVQFAVEGDTAGLRVGQFVTVQAATDEEAKGLALPRSSIVRSTSGQDVVFEHSSAERFTARPVRTAPLDATRILVAAGLEPGRRIVTQGAELLDQVR